jgi:hypothetical protein
MADEYTYLEVHGKYFTKIAHPNLNHMFCYKALTSSRMPVMALPRLFASLHITAQETLNGFS